MRAATAAEHGVPAGVSVAVVDRLEVVDVGDEHGDVLAARAGLVSQLADARGQRGAVEQAGEVVKQRRPP